MVNKPPVRESHVKRAAQLPHPPKPGKVVTNLPLELLPEWMALHNIQIDDVTWEFGGPLILKGKAKTQGT